MGLVASTAGRESDEDESLGLHNISLWSEILVMQNMMHCTHICDQKSALCPSGQAWQQQQLLTLFPSLEIQNLNSQNSGFVIMSSWRFLQ